MVSVDLSLQLPRRRRRVPRVGTQAAPPLQRRIWFRSHGDGPLLVVIPDICTRGSELEDAADHLQSVRVVRPAGSGGSSLAALGREESIRCAALRVIDGLELSARNGAVVAAEGGGGFIAAEMAALAPWVRRLALIDTPLTADALVSPAAGSWRTRRRWSATCREFLTGRPLIERLRDLDRPVLIVEHELRLIDAIRQPPVGGRIRTTNARDAIQLATRLTSFAAGTTSSDRFQAAARSGPGVVGA